MAPLSLAAIAAPSPLRLPRIGSRGLAFLVIALAAFAIRAPNFDNPDVDFDETFYLLVGDRLLSGELPFVDIWDRKPVGLFLIYGAIRLLGGEGIVQYQLVAAGFAAGTACLLYCIARRWVAATPAVAVAILYLLHMRLFASSAGQAETFFNLLLAASAWALLRVSKSDSAHAVRRTGAWTMLMCGLALQIKYMIVPQCLFFGLGFLWLLHRRGVALPRLAGDGFLFALIGLAPSLTAFLAFATLGEAQAFVQANFQSIFLREALDTRFLANNCLEVTLRGLPLSLCAAVAAWRHKRANGPFAADLSLLAGWLAASLLGFVLVGNVYIHYFAPVLLPLVLLATPSLERIVPGFPIFAALSFWAVQITGFPGHELAAANRRAMDRIVAITAPHLRDACLYVYDGPSSAYLLTRSCLPPTRFVYPDHLNNSSEASAIGVAPSAEVTRILASRPGAIVVARRPVVPRRNPETEALVRSALARDYRLADTVRSNLRTLDIFVLHRSGANR